MARVTKKQEAAEAICSALYSLDFEAIGETDDGTSWFTRGRHPKNVRIAVEREVAAEFVTDISDKVICVRAEWRNYHGKAPAKGQQQFFILCDNDQHIALQVEAAVEKVLLIFRDVLAGEGVAGAQAIAHLDL